jgi:L,D-peptidoglycan transpeptidase YkuD (ErfK/YbiS/YcfS/YnhG family)
VRRRRALAVLLLLLVVVGAWTATGRFRHGAAGASATSPVVDAQDVRQALPRSAVTSAAPAPATGGSTASAPAGSTAPAPVGSLAQVAWLGPTTAATVPAASTQAVLVRGDVPDLTTAAVELYERDTRGWRRTGGRRGHIGARGWTDDHREGDLRTPVGTFGLSDAGGRLADPGTELPYHRSADFVPSGDGVFGDSLAGSFDYVLAIDFNRVRGRSPLDPARPQGQERGGGIWLHVDHDGPTHGCVSVPEDGLKTLLRALLRAAHPVVVMADAPRLAA